ncbi:PAS domain-containing sensor histidine kinase [Terrisporobacter sp.]
MKKEIYKNIIKNSKIAYLIINFKKKYNSKDINVEVIEQNKEFEKIFKILSENNILNKDITKLIISNWINKNFKDNSFSDFIEEIKDKGQKRLKYTSDVNGKKVLIDIYYLDKYFILIFNMDYDLDNNEKNLRVYNWAKDLNGVYLDLNEDYVDILNKGDIIGKKDEDIWSESEFKKFKECEEEVLATRNVKTFFQSIKNENNQKVYLESTIWPLKDKDNNIIGIRGSSIEVNDRLAFEKTLEQNEENFREITKYCDSVFIIRDENRATYVSPSFKKVFEVEPNELYKNINKLDNYFKQVEYSDNNISYNMKFDESNEGTGKIKLDSGNEKWIWYKFLPIRDYKGNITKRVGILTDVTKDKILEEEKNKFRLDFLANVSHELRTPVNLISSTIQLIKLNLKNLPQEDENKMFKYIDLMETNSLRLIRLINNLIDSTKIDAGFMGFTPINADIIRFVEDVCDSVIQYANFNKMNLIFDTDKEEEVVLFDPDIIERILLNLLSNAVKFNKIDGTIYVNLYTEGDEIIITIKDEGIGIPKEKLSCIFDRFEQVQSKNKIEKQGSGIGLYLVKTLVTIHEGKIKVESDLGKGSKFTVTIPKKVLENGEEYVFDKKENMYRRVNIEFSDV